ncbi:hypothetical protein Goklo_000935 [Gossypium klotzschianum]|uniref:Uncharacterized protein n=1 Tax=Gossypium klotzschianum TaxID=34286 RepID=A0A7J8VZA7_9ROSI|nr:hypothetical protein [Gossypium klotzschianum]
MPTGERVKVDSSDVRSYYSHGSTVISRKLIRFRIGICKKKTLSGELCGCFWMRFCISSIGQGSLYPQLED